MRQWFNYFKIWFLVCGIIIIVCGVVAVGKKGSSERVNNVCTETERVYDFADVLTDSEENMLRELIAKKEVEAKCDIVIVTLNQSLEDYAKEYDSYAYGSDYVMIFADNFYDECGFGWNKYEEADDGDGVILVDNWYREADGKIYTWMSTSGSVYRTYSSDMIDSVLDDVYDYVETDPYMAYKAYVEDVAKDMSGHLMPTWFAIIVPIVVAGVFIGIKLSGKEGKKTTTASTYVKENETRFNVRTDMFVRKTVTQRKIETSSGGGGGGGGHISSGGHSHGGGGHSR